MPAKDIRGIRKRGKKKDVLTEREALFCRELLCTRNYDIPEAAKAAGYTDPKKDGMKLMGQVNVREELIRLGEERDEKMDFTAETLLKELGYSALRDPLDLCDGEGKIVVDDLRKIPVRMRRCIDGIKVRTRHTPDGNTIQEIELKLTPKLQALELAMKHFGMLEPMDRTQKLVIDWDRLYNAKQQQGPDLLEKKILEYKPDDFAAKDTKEVTNSFNKEESSTKCN